MYKDNADEATLYYKMLQDRITLLLYTNQMGSLKIFSLQKQISKQKHLQGSLFVHMHLCSFIGPSISYLHLKNMHYFWRMNITNQIWLFIYTQFYKTILFSIQTLN